MASNDTITALGNSIINLIDKKTPIATANTVGMVKPDGSTIKIDANGVISSSGGGGGSEDFVSKSGDIMSGDLHVPKLIVDNRDTYDSVTMNAGPTDAGGNRIANYTCFMGDGYWTKVQSVWHPTNNYGSQGLLFYRADNGAIYNLCIDSNGNVIHNDRAAFMIKETYFNGTSGYRIWDDGYCEQWEGPNQAGRTTYNRRFLKTFRNPPHLSVSPHMNSSAGIQYRQFGYNITTTGFEAYTGTATDIISWKACGYLA